MTGAWHSVCFINGTNFNVQAPGLWGSHSPATPHEMQGIVINGCIRDSADIAKMPLGVKALATYPLKSSKRDPGLQNVPVRPCCIADLLCLTKHAVK